MFNWRQWGGDWRGVDCSARGSHARRCRRVLLGTLGCLVLLALPIAAQETAKAEPEAGVKACGQALWEARITEDSAGQ